MSAAEVLPIRCGFCKAALVGNRVWIGAKWWCGDCADGSEMREDRIRHRQSTSRIPRGFEDLAPRFSDEHDWRERALERVHGDATALAKICAWAADVERWNLVLTGPTGSGKTTGACHGAYMLLEESSGDEDVLFVDCNELAVARRHTRLGREAEIVTKAIGASVLLLDDLGAEAATEDGTAAIAYVLSRRYANGDPSIVTTWQSPKQVGDRYGMNISRRIFERAVVVAMKGRRP